MVQVRLRRVYDEFQHLIHEVAKFGVIGAAAYVLTVVVSNWLRFGSPSLGPLTSLGIAMIIAASLSYFANRHWTWRDRARSGLGREYGLFFLFNGIGLGIALLCLAISEYGLDDRSALARNISANVIGTILGTLFRFYAYRRWVFIDDPEPVREEEAASVALL